MTTDPAPKRVAPPPDAESAAPGPKRTAPSPDTEPAATKKAKVDAGVDDPYNALVQAITRASANIVDAIDRNTRAVRARDDALGKVVDELGHMSRVLTRGQRQEEERLTSKGTTGSGKENRLKSVVLKKH